jgi:serine/threonine protein kinase
MSHPSDEQLRLLLLAEDLPPPQRHLLEEHVNACTTCLDRLDGLVHDSLDDKLLLADLLLKGPYPTQSPTLSETPPAPLMQPPQVLGDYEILACLGAGGMGVVYKARHRGIKRLAAIKLLLPNGSRGAEQQERCARFHAEAQALARLRHANIITLYDMGEDEGRPWLALEWADGGTLAEHLASRPQPEHQAAAWVQTLAEAIDQAHQQGIIHRDLKPANVLLSFRRDAESSGRTDCQSVPREGAEVVLKITDFGVAKSLHDPSTPTRCGQALGTPEYMAPEQTGDPTLQAHIGPAADVYALGAILYEMLTGRPPFRADTPLETLRQVREEDPLPPSRLRPKLSRDLETICLKCLHKEPKRRYGSARALAEDLRRFRNGEAILARSTTWLERSWRWCRRHPSQAALLGLLGLFIVAVLAGLLWQFRVSNRREAERLAGLVERQLPHLQRAVLTTAQNEELRRLVARGEGETIQQHLLATIEQFRRAFTLPGETQPFMNLFVLDKHGRHLADSFNQARARSSDLPRRDYLRHFLDQPALPADAVYFSEVYRSVHDGHYKFAVITRIHQGRGASDAPAERPRRAQRAKGRAANDPCVGFLAASIPLDARLVAVNMHNERAGASVVGPMDWNYATEMPDDPPAWVVVLHGGYDTPGGPPHWPGKEQLRRLQAFTEDPACSQFQQHATATGGCADYVRVGQTHFVVIVEKNYPLPLCYVLDRRLLAWWLLGLATLTAGLVGYRLLVRRS